MKGLTLADKALYWVGFIAVVVVWLTRDSL